MDLKERIQSKGLKQKWIAEQIDVNPITLNAYLNGERNMPQDVSDKIKKLIET
jgi:plasmid maintenance system antidote protein VapI